MQCNSSRGSQIRKKTLGRVQIRLLVLFYLMYPPTQILMLLLLPLGLDLSICSRCVSPPTRCTSLHFHSWEEKTPLGSTTMHLLRRRLVADRLASGHWAGAAPGLALTRLARQPNFPGCSTPVEQEVDNGQKQKTNDAIFCHFPVLYGESARHRKKTFFPVLGY